MNKQELEKIKQKALEEHIPIIMDDTLEVVDQILKEVKPQRILEEPKRALNQLTQAEMRDCKKEAT